MKIRDINFQQSSSFVKQLNLALISLNLNEPGLQPTNSIICFCTSHLQNSNKNHNAALKNTQSHFDRMHYHFESERQYNLTVHYPNPL